jgi:hypothetical protein
MSWRNHLKVVVTGNLALSQQSWFDMSFSTGETSQKPLVEVSYADGGLGFLPLPEGSTWLSLPAQRQFLDI